jgi:hypothetical protein
VLNRSAIVPTEYLESHAFAEMKEPRPFTRLSQLSSTTGVLGNWALGQQTPHLTISAPSPWKNAAGHASIAVAAKVCEAIIALAQHPSIQTALPSKEPSARMVVAKISQPT